MSQLNPKAFHPGEDCDDARISSAFEQGGTLIPPQPKNERTARKVQLLKVLHHKDSPQTSASLIQIETNSFVHKGRRVWQQTPHKHYYNKSGLNSIFMLSTAMAGPC